MHWRSCCVQRWFWRAGEGDEEASGEFRARLWANLTNFTLFGASGTNGRRGTTELVLACTSGLVVYIVDSGGHGRRLRRPQVS